MKRKIEEQEKKPQDLGSLLTQIMVPATLGMISLPALAYYYGYRDYQSFQRRITGAVLMATLTSAVTGFLSYTINQVNELKTKSEEIFSNNEISLSNVSLGSQVDFNKKSGLELIFGCSLSNYCIAEFLISDYRFEVSKLTINTNDIIDTVQCDYYKKDHSKKNYINDLKLENYKLIELKVSGRNLYRNVGKEKYSNLCEKAFQMKQKF
jgi:hypothetical protein